ncbi:class I SAM-dependent methyltransferase [Candidatus Latescibacterota bacterium]
MFTQQDYEIGKFFDNCANKGFMADFDEDEKRKLESCFKSWNIQKGNKILEPGCGSGRLTVELAKRVGDKGKVIACDISEQMINLARKREVSENITFLHCPVTSIPVNDNYFDIILCFQVFPHFSERSKALNEIYRVLKSDGVLRIVHLAGKETINKRHHDAGDVIISHKIPDETEMRELLSAQHFSIEEIRDTSDLYSLKARKIISR